MVIEAYQKLLDSREIHQDAHQKQAVDALSRLSKDLHKAANDKLSKVKFWDKSSAYADLKGLYIWGSVGRGKTMLMDLFCSSLPENVSVRRLHFHEFMREVHDFLHEQRQQDDSGSKDARRSRMMKYAEYVRAQAQVLCFDEFHVTDIGDAVILGNLFSALFEKHVIVVATSNWHPKRLYEGGLQRDQFLPFIDLIKAHMNVFNLAGDVDYRTQTLQESGTYFSPLGQVAYKKAEALFSKLTDDVAPIKDVVKVKSRKIKVDQAVGGIARFTFAQLCERPRAANDYLAIAERYHTVFIDKVPKLGYDRRNEVKRLMTLIDTFYDRHINVVITADAPADKLYTGDDYAFEFERTVSRLQEMQSDAYIEATKT